MSTAGTELGEHETADVLPAPTRVDRRARVRRTAWSHWAPLLLVVVPIVFNLWVLRAELQPVHNLNDTSVHASYVEWAQRRIDEGKVPLDGWYPDLSLGFPNFHHYQSLPHITSAYLGRILGTDRIVQWTLYLLLASWPLSVYLAARLFGFGKWTAATTALVSPLLHSVTGYGYEHASYVWRGNGIWSQLWAMWLLPLALGLSWRAVAKGKGYALAALAVGLTFACHFLTGYLALLALGLFVVVTPSAWRQRIPRALAVGAGSLLAAAWVVVPLLTDSKWANQTEFNQHKFWSDSFGAGKVLGWLAHGELLDFGRFPVVTLLAAVGLGVAVTRFRAQERYRVLIAFTGVSLLLFFGRPTLGPLLDVLPGGRDLLLHRYIMGVHLGAIFFAGIGIAWSAGRLYRRLESFVRRPGWTVASAVAALLAILVLVPAWLDIHSYDATGAEWIHQQAHYDATDGRQVASLVRRAESIGGGRVYSGMPNGWGRTYRVGQVPTYVELLNHGTDGIGFTLRTFSLMSDVEARFDEANPVQYDLFDVRYLILPNWHRPAVPASLVTTAGAHSLYRVETTGYLDVVDTVAPPIVADRSNLGRRTAAFLGSAELARKAYPTVAYDGSAAASPTVPPGTSVTGPAGSVGVQYDLRDQGVFGGRVVATRKAVVLLKATYHPRWHVKVDGQAAKPIMVAPGLVGVVVSPGTHRVEFRYELYPYYPYLFALGLLALLALALVPRFLPARSGAGGRHRRGGSRSRVTGHASGRRTRGRRGSRRGPRAAIDLGDPDGELDLTGPEHGEYGDPPD